MPEDRFEQEEKLERKIMGLHFCSLYSYLFLLYPKKQ
ncbi:hypothetical protein CIY_30970 [Butyrivibrio fibrisolvens 16/4]|nr:hypothetical protein CIY_30970 [Butyrivibrio fibrisolvens 16/4]